MKKLKIYIDTSVISHLQADDTPDRMMKTHKFWENLDIREYEFYISELVMAEINNCPEPKRSYLESLLRQAPLLLLELDDEVFELAEKYIDEGIFPIKYRDDAIHVALASVYNCNVVVSWNFKHMVKIRTILGVNGINKLMGYLEIEIVTPEFITEEEDNDND
jgi:predicted nucleic acid-binding protein